jgi:putative ABC transport system permease protein
MLITPNRSRKEGVWRASLRDLQWRRRRFLIAIAATALVLAMTLLMAGVSNSLHAQDRRIIASFDGDAWFVAANASGPFTTTTLVPVTAAADAARLPGVTKATAVLLSRSTIEHGDLRDVNVVALPPGGLGEPAVTKGRVVRGTGEVVVDSELGIGVGQAVNVGGRQMEVVGTASDVTYYFGTPTVYLSLEDAQQQLLGGQPLASAVVVQGEPLGDLPGLTRRSVADVRADLARPTESGDQTIQFINVLLWLVAAGILGSIVYLSALERARDFAVMKATGVTNGALLVGLVMQAVALAAASAVLAAVFALLLAPGFPFEISITGSTYLLLVIVALAIGLLASAAGLRRAVRTDPALAFGGA